MDFTKGKVFDPENIVYDATFTVLMLVTEYILHLLNLFEKY